jgi:hypothetical protein
MIEPKWNTCAAAAFRGNPGLGAEGMSLALGLISRGAVFGQPGGGTHSGREQTTACIASWDASGTREHEAA